MPKHTSSLPIPDHYSQEHADLVLQYLRKQIAAAPTKRLNFAEYMQDVLYAPGLGYYAVGNRKFGKEGDFITAPEVSPLFSQCIALQVKQIFDAVADPVLLEFGAGSGKMALDIMQALAEMNTLPKAYYILEVSAELKLRQQQFLQQHAPNLYPYFKWLTSLPAKPFNGVILANEVLDAMPFQRFQINNHQIQEWYVIDNGRSLDWLLAEPSTENLKKNVLALNLQSDIPYTSEMNLLQSGWIQSLSDCLQQGLILLFDYGYPEAEYYHAGRTNGTMKCFFRYHQHEDPLILPGIQDITAHVNFTAIARAASAADLDVADYTTQGCFLLNCGIEKLVAASADKVATVNAAQQLKKLTLPTEMGELFKVIGLSRRIDLELLGFTNFSRLRYL